MTIPRATGTGTEPRVSLPRPSGIAPRFVSHSNKITHGLAVGTGCSEEGGCIHGLVSVQGGGLNSQQWALSRAPLF